MSRRTYLTSGQPKPREKDARHKAGKGTFRSSCIRCDKESYAHNGPSFLYIDCINTLRLHA